MGWRDGMTIHLFLIACFLGGNCAAVRAEETQTNSPVLPSHSNEEVDKKSIPEVLVILGAGGTPEYAEEFQDAGRAWCEVLNQRNVVVVDGTNAKPSPLDETGPSDRALVLEHLQTMAAASTPDSTQVRWVVMIGHGTHDASGAKFNLRGPDIESKEIASVLNNAPGRWVLVHAFSSSGPFIHALSGKERIIITATKSGSEQNYSRFAKYLALAIDDPKSDLNHDSHISVLEAFLAASKSVAQFYSSERRLATEQALLDDNGDKRGTPANFFRGLKPAKAPADGLQSDGDLARRLTLHKLLTELEMTPEMEFRADQIEERIAELRREKTGMDPVEYHAKLEKLLLEMADALGVSTPEAPE